ncbi:hypothetical protein ACFL6M_03150 [Candidatus Eisenbacteria bacterium]|uniref:Uncharacterized protein n=1 Tax=Eiseniibacteriota bacterium TaxID=2212470 RepID=A0ABV6YJP9_UNCEI
MSNEKREFNKYTVWYSVGKLPEAVIYCHYDSGSGAKKHVGTINFYPDSINVPNSIVTPSGKYVINMPKRMYAHVMDLLRHEKPLFLLTDWGDGYLSTSSEEPIGELEPVSTPKNKVSKGGMPK